MWYMLKIILRLLLFIELILFSVGYFFKNSNSKQGDFIIGIAVFGMAFVLLPFFLYVRYKDKNLSQYLFPKDPIKKDKNDRED